VMAADSAVAIAGSMGNFELNTMRPLVIHNFLRAARMLGDACEKFWFYSVEGTEIDRRRIEELVNRSLMLVTALSPVIGYDKAAKLAHQAHEEGTTLREVALRSGWIDAAKFDEIVDAKKMV